MSGSLILSPGCDVDTAAIEFESHSKSPFRSACLIPTAGLDGDIILFRRSMSESSSIPNEKIAACLPSSACLTLRVASAISASVSCSG